MSVGTKPMKKKHNAGNGIVEIVGAAQPTAFDCFAGCGGMTEGFRQAGYRVVGAIETDPCAVAVYKLNHPHVRVWHDDVKNVTAQSILRTLSGRAKITSHFGWCQCVVPAGKSFVPQEWETVKFSIGDSFAFFIVLACEAGADAKSGRGFRGSDVTGCGFVTV